jgi:hypothetical protein
MIKNINFAKRPKCLSHAPLKRRMNNNQEQSETNNHGEENIIWTDEQKRDMDMRIVK